MNAATERIARKFIGAVEDEWQLYSNTFSDYTIGASIGFGASSIVYAAKFQPPGVSNPTPCALKVLDLDRLPPHALRLLQRETQLMSLSKHPNVLRVRGTWVDGHKLYIAMRLMNAGSAADVMRYGWPGGMQEEVVRCILKQALEGINYLHINGLIHRDIKAANMLIDDDGTVLLGDLGVAAFVSDADDPPPPVSPKRTLVTNSSSSSSASTPTPRHSQAHALSHAPSHSVAHSHSHSHALPHSHPHLHLPHVHAHPHPLHRPRIIGKRKSFVGTPCWMAPEVINGRTYDSSADIWSFGITALELTQGRAPRSLLTLHAALLQTVQDAPPRLDRAGGVHTYSRAFQDVVTACLDKNPARRPTAEELLATPFFRGARKPSFLVGTVLKGLPPLALRQERCRQPSVVTHGTMDSWDFSSMPTSPVQSVYGHHKHGTSSTLPEDGVFEIEDGVADTEAHGHAAVRTEESSSAQAYAERVRAKDAHAPSRSHSRNVTWAEEHPPPIPSDSEPEPDPPRTQEKPPASNLGVGKADEERATLSVPAAPMPSTSPSSSYSSTTSKMSSSETAATSVSSVPASPMTTASPSKLWRRLTGRGNDGQKQEQKEKEKGNDGKGGTLRKKTLGAVLGRTASRTLCV